MWDDEKEYEEKIQRIIESGESSKLLAEAIDAYYSKQKDLQYTLKKLNHFKIRSAVEETIEEYKRKLEQEVEAEIDHYKERAGFWGSAGLGGSIGITFFTATPEMNSYVDVLKHSTELCGYAVLLTGIMYGSQEIYNRYSDQLDKVENCFRSHIARNKVNDSELKSYFSDKLEEKTSTESFPQDWLVD